MKAVAPFVLALLASVAFGCSESETTAAGEADSQSATPLPSDQQALLGTFEVQFASTSYPSSGGPRTRVDFVNLEGKLAVFLQGGYGIGFQKLDIDEVTDTTLGASFVVYGRTARVTITRDADGKPKSATIDNGGEARKGDFETDSTAPTLGAVTPGLPWEVSKVSFSEGLLARDVKLPVSGQTAYTLLPLEGTPWVGAIGLRRPLSSTWDIPSSSAGIRLGDVEATDPTGNNLRSDSFEVRTLAIGKATKAYDFSKDEPAYPPRASRLVGDCDGAESCLRLSQGAKIALRIAAGSRVLRLRYALRAGQFGGTAPSNKIGLKTLLAPGDGSEPKETAGIEVAWTALPTPTATRAFATAYVDLEIPLPRVDAETGISLVFDGEPRTTPTTTDGGTTTSTTAVEARHMIMLLKSAIAE